MRRAPRIVLFAAVVAGGTVAFGWWTIPLLAALWVRVLPSARRPMTTVIVGAALGWLALLGYAALHGPVPAASAVLSAVFNLPPWGFLLATLLFPAALAGAAAVLTNPASNA